MINYYLLKMKLSVTNDSSHPSQAWLLPIHPKINTMNSRLPHGEGRRNYKVTQP